MLRILSIFALTVITSSASAQLAGISNADASSGLKQSLNEGAIAAIGKLGAANGFFGNPQFKILLPLALQKVESALRLAGGQTSVTDYFKRTTRAQLTQRFLPIVKTTTDKVGLAQQYNSLAGQGAQLGLIKKDDAKIENYVTAKALDGLYFMIGEQEKALRANPLGATSDIVKKVFGALK